MAARLRRHCIRAALVLAALSGVPTDRVEGQFWTWANTNTVVFPTPGVAQFDAGEVQAVQTVVILVWPFGGGNWTLNIRTDDVDMGNAKPVTDVLWRRQGAGGWSPLTNANQPVAPGQSGFGIIRIEFKLRLGWATDGPGNYQSDVVFAITP